MKKSIGITIPEGIAFTDLKLERHPETLTSSFEWGPIEAICAASGIDIAVLREDEDNVAGLIWQWYIWHREHGGAPDAVQEQIIAEVLAEDEHGAESVQPGTGRIN